VIACTAFETSESVRQVFWGGLLAGISEVGAAVLEAVEIALLVVGDVPFPAGKKDADPFEGDRTQGGMMAFAFGTLVGVESLGPRTVTNGTSSVFVKGLTQELWIGLAEVGRATASHRSNAQEGS
jgi:hypothetical protein